jgi:hypothetical protein
MLILSFELGIHTLHAYERENGVMLYKFVSDSLLVIER